MKTSVQIIKVVDPSGRSPEDIKAIRIRTDDGELKSHFLYKLLSEGVVLEIPQQLAVDVLTEVKRLAHGCPEYPIDMMLILEWRASLEDPDCYIPPELVLDMLDERREIQKFLR